MLSECDCQDRRGTAQKIPTTAQEMKVAHAHVRIIISHCARATSGSLTRTIGVEKAPTDHIRRKESGRTRAESVFEIDDDVLPVESVVDVGV